MKKLIALLLAVMMCLSLAACGNSKVEANADNSQEQDTEISQQDEEQTENTADESEQVEEEPQKRTIEITLYNWQEYLEINQYLSVRYSTNAFDEVMETYLELFTILEPKEAYLYYAVDVAVEFNVDYRTSDISYNLNDFSFELTDCVSHPDATVNESEFRQQVTTSMVGGFLPIERDLIVNGKVESHALAYWGCDSNPPSFAALIDEQSIEQNEDGTGYLRLCPTNIQITRIEGTLEYND